MVGLLIAIIIYQLLRIPVQLNAKVKEKTYKLREINQSLQAEIIAKQQMTQDLKLWKRALIESSNGALITDLIDPEGLVKYPVKFVNKAFTDTTGYTLEEVKGKNCSFLQGEDTNPETSDTIRQCLSQGKSCQVILKNYRKDKTPFWNELRISPIKDEEGNLTGFLGFQIDVTDSN